MDKKHICILHTGGTIGMVRSAHGYMPKSGYLETALSSIPDLSAESMPSYTFVEMNPLLDSSDMAVNDWNKIGEEIANRYDEFDGFVVLHGTDTMAYTAAALSFMLKNLNKPVILTGSQIPLCEVRSDGVDNIVTSLIIAGDARVREVCLYFGGRLLRGNRATKMSADGLLAFDSPNCPRLAEAGISIRYNRNLIRRPDSWEARPIFHTELDTRVSILKIHPGITPGVVRNILLGEDTRAVIIETYGAGNAPSKDWFLSIVREASERGKILLNITQCVAGCVNMDIYATGKSLKAAGVINGYDSTTESALGKLFYLLGVFETNEEVKSGLEMDLRGEISK